MQFLLFEIPVFLLIAGKGHNQFLISLGIFLAVMLVAAIIKKRNHLSLHFEISYPLTSSIIVLVLAALFCLRWHTSGRIIPLANFLQKPVQQTAILLSLLMAVLSLVGINHLIEIFAPLFFVKASQKLHKHEELYVILFIILTAFFTMFLNSRCSPLYPFNDWQDPNTMFTVGKGVLKGYVPYRDLYEQKGPMLVFIHTFGALISYNSFLGIWLLELLFCSCFLYFSYKTAAIFFDHKIFIFIPMLAAAIYSPFAFRAGDTAEEFALPMLAYALYTGIKSLKEKQFPTKSVLFLTGVTSGFVFWLKYSMIGFYFGWFFGILFFSGTSITFKKIFFLFLHIFFGVAAISSLILLYFALNTSLTDLVRSYFYNNIVYYSAKLPLMLKFAIGFKICRTDFTASILFSIIGIIWLAFRKQFRFFFFITLSILTSYFFIFCGGARGPYYCLPLGIFSIFGCCAIFDISISVPYISQKFCHKYLSISVFALLGGSLSLCFFSHNLMFLEFHKNDMFQYKMKSIIERSGREQASILHYEIGDSGVNTTAGLIPDIKYFCYYNNDEFSEIKEEQERCIKQQCADYIIARTKFENFYPKFETYDHAGAIVGMGDLNLEYFHYYTPKPSNE